MASSDSTSASLESQAIRCHFASLAKAITDPLGLSMEFFSKEVIEEVTMEEVDLPNQTITKKSKVLLSAVMRRVEARPNLFQCFIDILRNNEDHILRELGGKLETTYRQIDCPSSSLTKQISHPRTLLTEQIGMPPPPQTKQNSPLPQATLPMHLSLLQLLPQTQVCHYANYLRAFYQTSELPAYNKWPRTPSTKFINLAVISRVDVSSKDIEKFMLATLHGGVDQILCVKAPISIGDILIPKPGETLQCILVEGAPGVGKTTLAWEVCKKWGERKLFQQFAIVMLLQLRDQTVQNASNIADLVFYRDQDCQENEACRRETTSHLIQTNGRDVLIILEGLDELPLHLLTQSSIFTRLLSGTLLPHATIFITSRPSATVQLWQSWEHRVSRHIEVLGFTDENISQYIASVLSPRQLPDFQYYLSMNTHIKTTMYIPLHAAIVIEVYRWCQHPRRPLPETVTQLYTCLVNIILRRYLDSHPDYKGKKIQLQTVTDLPPPVYAHFYSLTQLAYTGVTQQKLIFQDQDQPINHLGFMDEVAELFPTPDNQVSYSYNFLHLSIQEYLAAYYVSTMEIHEQEQLLGTMCAQTHLQNMARFLAGLTKFRGMHRDIVKTVLIGESWSTEEREEKENVMEARGKNKATQLSVITLQLLYECGDASILDNSQCYVCPLEDYNPLFDFSVLGYCITHSNCKWSLELGTSFQRMESTERIQMLVQVLKNHSNSSYTYSIECIVCCYSALQCVEHLISGIPQSILLQLQTLKLVSNHQPLPQCVPELTPTMKGLCKLSLYYATGATLVHRTVQAVINTHTLKKLTLNNCDIDYECVTTLCHWLSRPSQLEMLEITLPSSDAIKMISTALTTNSTLKTLDLLRSEFSLPAMQAICSMLTYNNVITELKLVGCHIGDSIICCLTNGLHSNNSLTTLDIRYNSISDRGAISLARMLKVNNTLQRVELSYNQLGIKGQMALKEVEATNKHIELHY